MAGETDYLSGIGGGAASGAAAGSVFGPYGTAIGAGVGALAGAYGTYASQAQQNAALGSIPRYEPVDYTGIIDYLNGNYSIPSLENYGGTPYDTGYGQYLQAGNKYAGRIGRFLENTNDRSNREFRKDLFGISPTLQGNIAQQGTNTSQFLRGQIPLDVQNLVKNNAAQTSLTGGFGGSQMARNLVARDLGLTSLDLIGRGNQGLDQQFGLAKGLNPFQSDTLQYLMTPAQLQQQQVNENRYVNQSANTNELARTSAENQRAMSIADLMSAQAVQNATGINTNNSINWQRQQGTDPALAALFTGAGSLASSYGGGWGFGGSPSYGASPQINHSQSLDPYLKGFGSDDISRYV